MLSEFDWINLPLEAVDPVSLSSAQVEDVVEVVSLGDVDGLQPQLHGAGVEVKLGRRDENLN